MSAVLDALLETYKSLHPEPPPPPKVVPFPKAPKGKKSDWVKALDYETYYEDDRYDVTGGGGSLSSFGPDKIDEIKKAFEKKVLADGLEEVRKLQKAKELEAASRVNWPSRSHILSDVAPTNPRDGDRWTLSDGREFEAWVNGKKEYQWVPVPSQPKDEEIYYKPAEKRMTYLNDPKFFTDTL